MARSTKHAAVTTLSRQTLDSTAGRALALLRAIGADPHIHVALRGAGWTDDDNERGWMLLRNAVDAGSAGRPVGGVVVNPITAALRELETWNSTGLVRARAALRHLHPEQETFVFGNVGVVHGLEVVLAVESFVDRCEALESGNERAATHDADLAALATLDKRGVTKAERMRVRELVRTVQSKAAPPPVLETISRDDRNARIMQLRAWVLDWSDTARTVITRRDQLIRLGIGRRRAKKIVAESAPPAAQIGHGPLVAHQKTTSVGS